MARAKRVQPCCFNPRTHEGCDIMVVWFINLLYLFQSTHPRGVRHSISSSHNIETEFQSTHPRGVRQGVTSVFANGKVSIHAPTRGATVISMRCDGSRSCFNPRTHEGCDCFFVYVGRCYKSFNPRTHEGCDLQVLLLFLVLLLFQSTHPRGVRHEQTRGQRLSNEFQSTHPRGVRRIDLSPILDSKSFNPRTHEGCDCSPILLILNV